MSYDRNIYSGKIQIWKKYSDPLLHHTENTPLQVKILISYLSKNVYMSYQQM